MKTTATSQSRIQLTRIRRIVLTDVTLAAGDRVGSLEVIASPGHTPGHVAFSIPASGP